MTEPPSGSLPWARLGLALAVAVAALALYLPGIGRGDFVGDDEALDAGVVWEMARSGDWLFPEFNGEYLPPKPPLFYWVARLFSFAHGEVDEWSQRAPSAFAAAVMVGLVVAGAAPLIGEGQAVLAGVMLATMPVVHAQARSGRCDMLLALLVMASLLTVGRMPDRPGASAWLFWSLLGLAAICKGGAGPGLVAFVLVGLALAERSAARLRRLLGPSVAAFVLIAGAWYALGIWHWGARFVDEQLVGENLHHLFGGSALSDRGPGGRSLAYHLSFYARELFLTTLPWGLLLPAAIAGWWRAPAPPASRFFVVWLFGGLFFFTLAARKSPYYLLPLTPAVAVLASGWLFGRVVDSWRRLGPGLRISGRSALTPLLAAIGGWLATLALPSRGCGLGAVARGLGGHPLTTIGGLWLVLAATAALPRAVRLRHWAAGVGVTACLLAGAFLIADRIEGPRDACASLKPFAREVAAATRSSDRVWFFRDPLPAVVLYAERRIPTLRNPAGAEPTRPFYLIVPQSLASEVPATWRAESTTVVRARARVFTRREMGIELVRVAARPDGASQSAAAPAAGGGGSRAALTLANPSR